MIEDEKGIRETVELLLVSKGYTVLTAADGKEAIDVYSQHANEVLQKLREVLDSRNA